MLENWKWLQEQARGSFIILPPRIVKARVNTRGFVKVIVEKLYILCLWTQLNRGIYCFIFQKSVILFGILYISYYWEAAFNFKLKNDFLIEMDSSRDWTGKVESVTHLPGWYGVKNGKSLLSNGKDLVLSVCFLVISFHAAKNPHSTK